MNNWKVSVFVFALWSSAMGFSPNSITPKLSSTCLSSMMVWDDHDDMLSRARECADSESCSIDDARSYLRQIVHVQSGCVAGTLTSHGNVVCEDVAQSAEVIAALRHKIEHGHTKQALSPFNALTASPLQPVYLGLTALYITILLTNLNDNVTPFTVQEWWWAIKGGYLDDMVVHYLRNGGL